MKFSKAIQIKQLVTSWNKDRSYSDFGYIKFECSMFSLGNWSVLLKPIDTSLFFSIELEQLITLYAGGGFMMVIGAFSDGPYIDMQ